MTSPAVPLPSSTAKEIRKELERRVPNGGGWKRISGSGLYFVVRLEPGLRLSGAAYRAGGSFRLRGCHGGTFGNPATGY